MSKTQREMMIEGLVTRGERIVEGGEASKYIKMTRARGGFYFIGRNGGLRVGWAVSRSVSLENSKLKALLLGKVPSEQIQAPEGI